MCEAIKRLEQWDSQVKIPKLTPDNALAETMVQYSRVSGGEDQPPPKKSGPGAPNPLCPGPFGFLRPPQLSNSQVTDATSPINPATAIATKQRSTISICATIPAQSCRTGGRRAFAYVNRNGLVISADEITHPGPADEKRGGPTERGFCKA